MKTLSREGIQRMVDGAGGGSVSGGGISSSDLAGLATQMWVNQNYLSIEFFSSLFKAYAPAETTGDPDVEVTPNGGDTSTITNIKAMFGFWTEQYISALGQGSGGGGGGATALGDLLDVEFVGNPSDGQVLKYNGTTHKWYNGTVQSGSSAWADITGKPTTIAGYGITDAYISNGTITLGSNSITPLTSLPSHNHDTRYYISNGTIYLGGNSITPLTSSDLSGYATQNWVTNQGYLTSSSISDMATKTWVGNQGYLTSSSISDMATKTWVGQQGFLTGASGTFWGLSWSNGDTINGTITPGTNDYYTCGTTSKKWNFVYAHFVQAFGTGAAVYAGTSTTSYIALHYSGTIRGLYDWNHNWMFCINSSGYAGIGTDSPSYKLHVAGVIYSTTGVYSAGYVTALSDERKKTIIEDFDLDVAKIANAPMIKYYWNDREDREKKAGSIAQYWQKLVPELTPKTADGMLSMDYGNLALMSAIAIARRVVDHEERIRNLEKYLH